MKAYVLHKIGKASNFKLENVDIPKLTKNDVLIKHKAIGINYFDIHFRRGDFPLNNINMPAILGLEACGIIEEIGSEVRDFKVGDRVAYATGGIGSYAEKKVIHQHHLILIPGNLGDAEVAAVLLKGLMAHALLFRVYVAQRAKRILVHAAAGGIGQILCSWAKNLGIEIIGTVGSDRKIPLAKEVGCDHVINYQSKDFLAEVETITKGEGVGIVYDGVGKDTILKSIDCLWPMGLCVSFGDASGPVPPIDLNNLLINSLYITRPLMALYKANRIELVLSANEVFKKISEKVIRPNITKYNFSDLVKAHEALESRTSTGSLVLVL